jgi:hypothetical protein
MANKARGEVDFILAGQTLTVRPTFTVLAEVESAIGGVLPFMRRLRAAEWKITEVVLALRCILKTAPGAPSAKDIPDLIIDTGVAGFLEPLVEFLGGGIAGGQKSAEGNGEAAGS